MREGPAPDVVIVGGGVVGASIAYHLVQRGVRNVLVLERDTFGAGSTSRNAGGIRQQFSTEINVRLSQRSVPRLERFKEEFGIDIQFQQVGYLFLITDERDVAPFERSLALWKKLGVPATRLDRDGIHEVFPEIVTEDVLFATFCPQDGHADPVSILNGFISKARAGGATFREHARVTGIETGGGRARGVRLDGERIPCATVVNATGAWAAELGRMVGLDVPVQPLRRQIFVTAPLAELAHPIPLTVEFSSSLYMHRESGGVLLGMADPSDAPGYVDSVNWEWMSTVVERGLARLPILEKASIRAAWAGFYEDTPDKHPILGNVEGVEGFVMAAGFSGHGVMHSPATGELIAELITDGKTSLDISSLALERFERGELVPEHNVI